MNTYNYKDKVKYVKEEASKCIKYNDMSGLKKEKSRAEDVLFDLKALKNNNYELRDEIQKSIDEMENLIKDINKVVDIEKEIPRETSMMDIISLGIKAVQTMYKIGEAPVEAMKRILNIK